MEPKETCSLFSTSRLCLPLVFGNPTSAETAPPGPRDLSSDWAEGSDRGVGGGGRVYKSLLVPPPSPGLSRVGNTPLVRNPFSCGKGVVSPLRETSVLGTNNVALLSCRRPSDGARDTSGHGTLHPSTSGTHLTTLVPSLGVRRGPVAVSPSRHTCVDWVLGSGQVDGSVRGTPA